MNSAGKTERRERLNFAQRRALRRLRRLGHKRQGEPLESEDWAAYWQLMAGEMRGRRLLAALPSNPRCGVCGAPFAGIGSRLLKPLGFKPSRKNPHICATCVELSPPGGMTMQIGVLFADLRGFTSRSEGEDPHQTVALLRRFYACAERVLFPDALIDKLIGDAVMALYVPEVTIRPDISQLMIDHARALLEELGYGSEEGPFAEAGIGLDFGEAFVGNIGDRSVYDFTAIGDVVNTASRLQATAAGGEVVYSARVAADLDEPEGTRETIELKGKAEALEVYRIASVRPATVTPAG